MSRPILLAGLLMVLSACTTMSSISSPQSGTTLMLREKTLSLPARQELRGTSFGNYEFQASDGGNAPTLYGILPLAFKGGHLAADIILFAPGMFFNLRSAFPFYEIDVKRGVIRYKLNQDDTWIEYTPKPEEIARAKSYFDTRAKSGQ